MSTSHLSVNAHNWRRNYPATAHRLATLALAAVVFFTGCSEKWVEVFPVSGTLKFDNLAPAGARIVLHPVNPPKAEGEAVAPTGSVRSDGSFIITSYKAGDGAPPGDYVATVEWYKFDEKLGGPGPNVIPALYANPKTSPIKVTVKGGGPTTVDPITISAAKTAARRPGLATARR